MSFVDEIILINNMIDIDWVAGRAIHKVEAERNTVHPGATPGEVSPEVYNAYRLGLDSACADIIICTREHDVIKVLLSHRSSKVCFGGYWWIHGGAIASFQTTTDFVETRAPRECKVAVKAQVCLGVFRTCAPDAPASTLNVCYAGFVPAADIRKAMGNDDAHSDTRLFSMEELRVLPSEQRHWYPMTVADLVFTHLPAELK